MAAVLVINPKKRQQKLVQLQLSLMRRRENAT